MQNTNTNFLVSQSRLLLYFAFTEAKQQPPFAGSNSLRELHVFWRCVSFANERHWDQHFRAGLPTITLTKNGLRLIIYTDDASSATFKTKKQSAKNMLAPSINYAKNFASTICKS